jgi:hypothetical protein
MKIQMKQADEKGVRLFATFGNIAEAEDGSGELQESPMITSDEDRIKQVLSSSRRRAKSS